jgi:thiamine pyrophosphate-dependent acetolactate synthase large subunit-like protein
MAMEMTGGEAVAAALETLGVRHVFGIVSVPGRAPPTP